MKIGIVTLVGDNHGNRLQNFALQQVLRKTCNTNEVYTLDFSKQKSKKLQGLSLERRNNFAKFNQENIKILHVESKKQLAKIGQEFDFFVAGSDQIWNPYVFLSPKIKFLRFADENKRISYSPSFGVDGAPKILRFAYAQGLKHMKAISVREDSGSKIVEKLIGTRPPVFLDPTMLLSRAEWNEFSGEKPVVEGKYICTYFLAKDKKHMGTVEEYAKKFNFKIVKLNDPNFKELFTCNPKTFVNVIKNAQMVCTDSFHGCVFSVIFERPLVVFVRQDLNRTAGGRMVTLFNKLQLESAIGKIPKNPLEMNFASAQERLQIERARSLEFLKECFAKGEINARN